MDDWMMDGVERGGVGGSSVGAVMPGDLVYILDEGPGNYIHTLHCIQTR